MSELRIANQKLRDEKLEADKVEPSFFETFCLLLTTGQILQSIEGEKRELQKALASKDQTIASLKTKQQGLNNTIESQRRALEESEKQEADISDQAKKCQEELDSLRKNYDALSSIKTRYEGKMKKLISLKTSIPTTETEVGDLFSEFGDLGSVITSDELEKLQTHLIETVIERNNELLNLHRKNEELQGVLTRWLNAAEMARERLEVEKGKRKDLQAQCRALDEELHNTRTQLANEVEGSRELYKEKFSQLETKVNWLQEEVEKQQQLAREEKRLRKVGDVDDDDVV